MSWTFVTAPSLSDWSDAVVVHVSDRLFRAVVTHTKLRNRRSRRAAGAAPSSSCTRASDRSSSNEMVGSSSVLRARPLFVDSSIGMVVSDRTIARVLRREHLGRAPRRGTSWSEILGQQADSMLACDFFTIESATLQTIHVLFFIEIGTRRHVAGVTRHPTGPWATQIARNFTDLITGVPDGFKFLIRDRDTKFMASFDAVFTAVAIRSSRHPCARQKRTVMPNDSSERSGASVWIGY